MQIVGGPSNVIQWLLNIIQQSTSDVLVYFGSMLLDFHSSSFDEDRQQTFSRKEIFFYRRASQWSTNRCYQRVANNPWVGKSTLYWRIYTMINQHKKLQSDIENRNVHQRAIFTQMMWKAAGASGPKGVSCPTIKHDVSWRPQRVVVQRVCVAWQQDAGRRKNTAMAACPSILIPHPIRKWCNS